MSRPAGGEGRCAVCGRPGLVGHLAVAGPAGTEGLIPTTLRFGSALADIARCGACGHMQLDPMPQPGALGAAYAQAASGDYLDEEAGQRATARETLARIAAHLPRTADPPRLLDVGCWLGFLLDEASRRGWRTLGLEPSRYASEHARERLGLEVRTVELEDAELPQGVFDAIVMADVIEHLVDPGTALDRLHGWAAPDAVLYLALPDAGSRVARRLGARWWSVLPTHVQYFTRASIRLLLRRHGWTPLELDTAPKAFTVAYYLSRLHGYSPALARSTALAAQTLGLAERLVRPDFRDRMGVLARRAPAAGTPPPLASS